VADHNKERKVNSRFVVLTAVLAAGCLLITGAARTQSPSAAGSSASGKIGVIDYRNLVEEKLRAAADLYRSMMDEFHQGRAFLLELMVVIILLIDLAFLFRGKS